MVTLDNIKILTNKNHIKRIDPNVTSLIMKNDISIARRYSQMRPYKAYMNYNLNSDKCVVEFSSKLLLDRYPELINRNNIRDCLLNFESLGFCDMDVDGVMQESEVLTCDITTDISGIVQPDRLAIKSCIRNHNKFRVQKYGNSGSEINKMVKTSHRKIRMIIYDKAKELRKKKNAGFLGLVNDQSSMLDYFDGKFRIEANINTQKQIRQLFQTDTTDLMAILQSQANPLLTLFDEVFVFPEEPDQDNHDMPSPLSHKDLKTVKNALLLEKCGYDMEMIDLVLKNTLSPRTDKSKYRAVFNKLLNSYPLPNKNMQVMKTVRDLIECSVN